MEYSYRKFFQNVYMRQKQRFAFQAHSREEAFAWKREFRKALWEKLGLNLLTEYAAGILQKECTAKLLGQFREEGYCRYKYAIQTLPEVYMPFYVLIPDGVDAQNPAAAMIAIPAHNANKNTVCGVAESPEEEKKIAEAPLECYGREFAKRGYVVFCPDLPGFGERIEPVTGKKSSLDSSCTDLSEIAEALGFSMAALEIWDLMRLLDFACGCRFVSGVTQDGNSEGAPQSPAKMPGTAQIGCAGFSGGGLCTMWLAALDERVQLAVISGYVHGYYDSILNCHRCACNFVPDLWRLCDISDICSLIAPRPLFLENGREDRQNGMDGIEGPKRQAEQIRRAYEVFGAKENVAHEIPEGMHRWYGLCYEFAEKKLPSGKKRFEEERNGSDADIDAVVGLLDRMTAGGDSRIKVNVVQNAQCGEAKREYHHGRCDLGSPWAKGECWDVLE